MQAMIDCVSDKLMADIVKDLRSGVASPSGLLKGEPIVKGSGWQGPPQPKDRTNEFRIFDRMVEAQVGGANDTSKLR